MKIVLASGSPRRKEILASLGLVFDVSPADIDERAIRCSDPSELVIAIAKSKMDEVATTLEEDVLLIGADTVVVVDGVVREKALTKEEAFRFLNTFNEKPQKIFSSSVIRNTKTGKEVSVVDETTVTFNDLPEKNIVDFIESGDVYEYAGALAAQHKLFKPYIHFDGEWESLLGLPKQKTKDLIADLTDMCPCDEDRLYKECHGK